MENKERKKEAHVDKLMNAGTSLTAVPIQKHPTKK